MNFRELDRRLKEIDGKFYVEVCILVCNIKFADLDEDDWVLVKMNRKTGNFSIYSDACIPSNLYFKALKVFADFMLEEEGNKRYIVPLPKLKDSWGEQLYLTQDGKRWFTYPRNKELRQTWKKKYLKWIPEEYRQFAVEVEED